MEFTREEENYHSQLKIGVDLGLPSPIKVVCVSQSRDETSFEIIDENGASMGVNNFRYNFGGFNSTLIEELNILLEEWGVQIDDDDFRQISKLAFSKCESRYGNNIDGGDCVISIN